MMPVSKAIDLFCRLHGVYRPVLSSRIRKGYTPLPRFAWTAWAYSQGYRPEVIMSAISRDRTSFYDYLRRHRELCEAADEAGRAYRKMFNIRGKNE